MIYNKKYHNKSLFEWYNYYAKQYTTVEIGLL